MDISDAMTKWKDLGTNYILVSNDATDGYFTYFVKNNRVEGHIKAESGGLHWDLPAELVLNNK